MINSVSLTGRLTRDIDLKYTQSGTAVATFTLAVDRQYKQEGQPDADFVNCVVWRKKAENLTSFTHKGSLIGIEGRIQTRTYDNAQGQKVYVTEVVVENFALLESKSATQAQPSEPAQQPQAPQQPVKQAQPTPDVTYQPQPKTAPAATYGANTASADPFANSGKSIDIDDSDLPF